MKHDYTPDAGSLLAVLRRLRAPDGCPWDRKQTRSSLAGHLAAECGELIEAIECNDPPNICEELGDVLMNLFFQVVIAEENGEFTIDDVWQGIIDKMIRRHVHVFGNATAATAEEVAGLWQQVKRQEKGGDTAPAESVMDGVKHSLSALERAEKLQKRAAEFDFDWETQSGIIAKIREELDEFEKAGTAENENEELGDLLFAVVNLIRYRKQGSSEELLRRANRKFENRFRTMEGIVKSENRDMEKFSAQQWDELWRQAKTESGK